MNIIDSMISSSSSIIACLNNQGYYLFNMCELPAPCQVGGGLSSSPQALVYHPVGRDGPKAKVTYTMVKIINATIEKY